MSPIFPNKYLLGSRGHGKINCSLILRGSISFYIWSVGSSLGVLGSSSSLGAVNLEILSLPTHDGGAPPCINIFWLEDVENNPTLFPLHALGASVIEGEDVSRQWGYGEVVRRWLGSEDKF
jgi:hypothetical protein